MRYILAGIYAENGASATQNSIEAVAEYDVDIKKHKSINIRNSKIGQMDLILCATEGHKKMIVQMYPQVKERVMTMKEYAYGNTEGNQDISDPWGNDIEVYRKCASEIEEISQQIIKKLLTNMQNKI